MGLLNCLLYDKDRHQITNTMKAFIFLCLVAAAMAEADPQFLYGNYGYNTFPSTYAYGGAYSPYTYGYNSFHYGKREAEADPALIYSSGYHYPTVYSGLSHGVYNTHYTTPYVYGGIHHMGKREAEAEADPALVYTAGLHTPYTYGLNYNTFGYNAYPYTTAYTHHYGYGKSEAEAEPWTVYGSPYTYGSYARPYSYGSYGNFYGGYRGWY